MDKRFGRRPKHFFMMAAIAGHLGCSDVIILTHMSLFYSIEILQQFVSNGPNGLSEEVETKCLTQR